MKYVILHLPERTEPGKVHEKLARSLDFPDYYGKNLDALYDVLSVYPEPVCFLFLPGGHPKERGFLEVLKDVRLENPRVRLLCPKGEGTGREKPAALLQNKTKT